MNAKSEKVEKSFWCYQKMQIITAIIVSGIGIYVSLHSLEGYFAKESEVKIIEVRLDQKILSDRVIALEERIWSIDDRYKTIDEMPDPLRTEYRYLQQECSSSKEQLKNLITIK